MTLELYVSTSERTKLNKTLSGGLALNGSLRDESSVVDPIILVEADGLSSYNYARIPDFGRCYFITDITSVRSHIWQVSLHCDPLMSFRDQLMNVPVIVEASAATGGDGYLSGSGQWVAKAKDMTQILPFPIGLASEGEFILITAGGG